ncbi:MAG: ribonuclease H-like domain-containing protein [Anaerolineales bacterium]
MKDNAPLSNYLAFDIEIAKILPGDFSQWRNDRPLGISCAATLRDGQEPELWYSRSEDGAFAKNMSQEDLVKLVKFLMAAVEEGMQILTWNGLGFDFDVLAEESGCWKECQSLAKNHTDLMFHIFCEKGYPIGLDKAAKGMRLAGKTEGMSGELAPILWQQGQYEKVLEYVAQDVRTTLEVAKAGLQKRRITWYSNRGKLQELGLPRGWLAVDQALRMPLPDNSWMSKPLNREDFLRWTTRPDANIR